jgi:hypothetical protein
MDVKQPTSLGDGKGHGDGLETPAPVHSSGLSALRPGKGYVGEKETGVPVRVERAPNVAKLSRGPAIGAAIGQGPARHQPDAGAVARAQRGAPSNMNSGRRK